MIINGTLLLIMFLLSPVAATCGAFAFTIIGLMPMMMGPNYKSSPGFGLVAGVPTVVGFFWQPGVFFFAALFTWLFLVGLHCSNAIARAKK